MSLGSVIPSRLLLSSVVSLLRRGLLIVSHLRTLLRVVLARGWRTAVGSGRSGRRGAVGRAVGVVVVGRLGGLRRRGAHAVGGRFFVFVSHFGLVILRSEVFDGGAKDGRLSTVCR